MSAALATFPWYDNPNDRAVKPVDFDQLATLVQAVFRCSRRKAVKGTGHWLKEIELDAERSIDWTDIATSDAIRVLDGLASTRGEW